MEKGKSDREQTPTQRTKTSGKARRGEDIPKTAPLEGKGEEGGEPGYTPTPEVLCLRGVYGDWVHANPGTHLDGSIGEDAMLQVWWRDLVAMPSRRYDAPSRRVGRRLVRTLQEELRGYRIDCGTRIGSSSSRR